MRARSAPWRSTTSPCMRTRARSPPDLPFRALSLSRYRLDDALLRRAEVCGAQIKRGVAVRSVMPDGEGWIVQCDNGGSIACRHLVLATGKLGLRGIGEARDGSRVGLKMHLRPSDDARRALSGRVELYFLDRSYAGLELVEDGIANLCLLLPRATGSPAGRRLVRHTKSSRRRVARSRRAARRIAAALGQTARRRVPDRRSSASPGGTGDLPRWRPARPYPALHRRRARHSARLGAACGRAYPRRPLVGAIFSGGAAPDRQAHPARRLGFRPCRQRRRTHGALWARRHACPA